MRTSMPTNIRRLSPILLLLGQLCFTPLISASTEEYLPADLRLRVDQLQSDLGHIETTQTNVGARAKLTWEWLNAFALNGGYVPVNATQIIAAVMAQAPVNPASMAALDATIDELTLLDKEPNSLGHLRADTQAFVAGSQASIQQVYTVGERDIQTGGGFLVARHFMPNFGPWQATDANAANYISITSSNARVGFVTTTAPLAGMHGGFRSTRPTMVFEVASGTLKPGDVVTITYGDTSSGGNGMTMPTFSSDRMPLPLYVAFTSQSRFYSLPIQPIRVIGSSLHGVTGFVPSVVSPGEEFELSIRAQDQFFNRATDDIPDWLVSLNGEPWLTVPSTGPITLIETSLPEAGTYFFNIESKDGNIHGSANPMLVTSQQRDRIYWGDTHGHSGFAEGVGTPERFMQWARDDARLDYVIHSEHDIWLDDAEWETLRRLVKEYTDDKQFIAYLGYEWTVSTTRGGHHNVLFRTPENRKRIPSQFFPSLSKLYQGLRGSADSQDVVIIPHAHQAGDYRQSDPELETLVEIMSQHGNFEWFGRMYLQHGHQVGFTAASDNHLSQPGYSAPQGGSLSQRGGLGAILAPMRTTDAIFDSMKNLRSYATTGDRIILDFSVNDAGMGQRAKFATQRHIEARVIGTAPIDNITVFKNDQVLWSESYLDKESSRMSKTDTFLLSFSSSSEPFHRHDNPRGWRAWEGTLEVHNATIETIEPVDASFPLQRIQSSVEEPNRLTFATKTRGDTSSYLIRLSDISRNTMLTFDLTETKETGGAPPVYRPAQRIPADSFSLSLKDIKDSAVSHTQTTDGYIDQTTLRRIIENGPQDVSLQIDDSATQQGDYYYMRVVQANDAIAWSSPVWIGGHAKQ